MQWHHCWEQHLDGDNECDLRPEEKSFWDLFPCLCFRPVAVGVATINKHSCSSILVCYRLVVSTACGLDHVYAAVLAVDRPQHSNCMYNILAHSRARLCWWQSGPAFPPVQVCELMQRARCLAQVVWQYWQYVNVCTSKLQR